jgi:hypothetical protein
MKKYLLTFGSEEYYGSINLLAKSCKDMVDGFFLLTEKDIPKEYYEKYKHIFSQKRGFGYWLWKPFFILKALEQIKDGDMLIYCDSATVIIDDLNYLFDLCLKNNGTLLFENQNGISLFKNENESSGAKHKNKEWTKLDCFNLMNCNESRYINGDQVDAAFQVYEKNDFNLNLLKEYLSFCENENILTDCPNITGLNLDTFIEHRHDQSILSLLAIKYKIKLEKCPSDSRNYLEPCDFPIIFFHHKLKLKNA